MDGKVKNQAEKESIFQDFVLILKTLLHLLLSFLFSVRVQLSGFGVHLILFIRRRLKLRISALRI